MTSQDIDRSFWNTLYCLREVQASVYLLFPLLQSTLSAAVTELKSARNLNRRRRAHRGREINSN
jgi:hypothetical protein